MKKLYFALIFLFPFSIHSQILINEVCSAGDTALRDEDGDINDWIEFYNAGSTTVDLKNYKLVADQPNNSKSWTFPQVFLPAGDRITVFFSGKDRRDIFDHWEVPVYPQVPAKYMTGVVEPPSNWKDPAFNDFSWGTSTGNVGYGDGDDATGIPPSISLYQRYSFNIADSSKIVTVAFLVDFDDGFVAYLNGKEIARLNVGAQGVPPDHSTYAFVEHEAVNYQNGGFSAFFMVPSAMLDTMIRQGTNTLAIQTHNCALGMDDMTMLPYFLLGVVDTSVTYFPFPADVHLHTDFELDANGQLLTLKDPQGITVDQKQVGAMMQNHSRGRETDAAPNWCLFRFPTPDTTNFATTSCYTDYGPSPDITLASGFYTGTQSTAITSAMPGTIYWTSDASDPNIFSPVYSSAITIPSSQTLRAKLVPSDTNYLPGPIAAKVYLVNENVTLPVVCITSDPYNLFDPYYGIYVTGMTPDTTCADIPFHDANFWQGWERPANVTYFDAAGNMRFEKPCSIKIQGNWSKVFPQRGFTVTADENYGSTLINYRLFPDKPSATYYNFNIRNGGSDWGGTHMRDRIVQKAVQEDCDLDMMDGFPAIMFINGQYWGVYEIRERQDKHYLQNNSSVDDDNVDFLEFDGTIIEGDNKDFLNDALFIGSSDMTRQSAYDSACAMVDISNFCDYFITETYGANLDWLGSYTNNIKFWKPHSGPGKWRYILWDVDGMFQSDTVNKLRDVIDPPVLNPHSYMLKSLLDNDSFRIYFINRYADLLNTTFYNWNMIYHTEDLYYEMLPEMPRNFAMWGSGNSPFAPTCVQGPQTVASWRNEVDIVEYMEFVRPYYVRNQIQAQFSMNGQVVLGLKTDPPGAGTIHLNTITPDSLPWNGIYFDGNPVTMTAIANPGYKFLYWTSDHTLSGEQHSLSVRTNVAVNDTFTAHFEALETAFNLYPNPFIDQLTLTYEVNEASHVRISVYDVTGRKVTDILPGSTETSPGVYTMTIDAEALGLSNGMYFFTMNTDSYSKTVKMICGKIKR